jgi:hypothetical protein
MSQIMTIGRLSLLLLIGFVISVGCSTPNDKAPVQADTEKHAAGWLPVPHMTEAQTNIAGCMECHGEDLLGGISKVSCVSCHLGGPTSVHPADWADAAILTKHGPYVVANDTTSCRNIYCHGNSLQGVANSGPTCNGTTPCHSYP